jgi:uncharacterized protein YjdB
MKCSYKTHIQNRGWGDWAEDGATSGTVGESLRMEAIQIRLLDLGDLDLGLEYQAHVENYGWMDVVNDGETAGTTGESLRLEAIRILLTGTDAPLYDILYRVHVQNVGWVLWKKNEIPSERLGKL